LFARGFLDLERPGLDQDIELDNINLEVAVWRKSIFDNRSRNFKLVQPLIASANFIPARAFGTDVTVGF
jgi:hypothetical protein